MTSINTDTSFTVIAESRIGGRAENQDTCAWQDTKHGLLLLVCDGMGGGPSGKVASQMAADAIVNSVLDSRAEADRRDVLARAIRQANEKLIAAQAADPRLRGMGTTVTALLINRNSAVVAHVGDSRVYLLRGRSKIFRTFDHSRVFELVKAKAMTEEDARTSGESNVITRALGPMEKVEPDIVELAYEKGDRFMLCTDGIWGAMPEKELLRIAGGTKVLAGAVESLVIKVDEIGRANGMHHDNLTVAILQAPFNSKLKQKMSTRIKYTLYALVAVCCISLLTNFVQYKIHTGVVGEGTETDDGAGAVVTRAELDKIIAKERERYDAEIESYRQQIQQQDETYAQKLADFQKILIDHSDSAEDDNREMDERTNALNADVANMAVVKDIDAVISVISEMKKTSDSKKLVVKSKEASRMIDNLSKKITEYKISNERFNKCVKEKWAVNTVAVTPGHAHHQSHLEAIISTLESLKTQVKSRNKRI